MSLKKSTIVRVMLPMFAAMEKVAPWAGAVLAERLWCTIPRARKSPPQQPGDIFTVKVNGRNVVAEAWGDGPVIYLVHGWGGNRHQLDAFVGPLLWAGHRVIMFDAPSHGDSAPGVFGRRRGLLPEFYQALAAVVAVGGPAHAVIGHSLGGMATAIAVLDGLPVRRLALISATADVMPYTVEFAQALGFGERIRQGFLSRLERRVGRRMDDFGVPARARTAAAALPSTLVVHDRGDKEVHHGDAEDLVAAWPGAQLMTTTGLGHRRILHDPHVIDRVVAHVRAVVLV